MPEINKIKCIIAGDPAVGKTAITQMFTSDGSKFPKSYNLTFGVELSVKCFSVEENNENMYEFLIYDSSGHDLYSELLQKVWKGAHLLLVIYDITSEQSLDNVDTWVESVRNCVGAEIPCAMFGNKTDLSSRRKVKNDKVEDIAHKLNVVGHMEGSAKENDGIKEIFSLLVNSKMP